MCDWGFPSPPTSLKSIRLVRLLPSSFVFFFSSRVFLLTSSSPHPEAPVSDNKRIPGHQDLYPLRIIEDYLPVTPFSLRSQSTPIQKQPNHEQQLHLTRYHALESSFPQAVLRPCCCCTPRSFWLHSQRGHCR